MSNRVYAASTCGGGKHGGFEEERKPVDLTGGLILKLREYSFPKEGSQVPRNSDLCAQGVWGEFDQPGSVTLKS